MFLEEETVRPLESYDACQAADEQNLQRNRFDYFCGYFVHFTYIAYRQQTPIKNEKNSKKQESDAESREADADF